MRQPRPTDSICGGAQGLTLRSANHPSNFYNRLKKEITSLFRSQLITEEIEFNRNNNKNGAIAAAQELLGKKIGAANLEDGYAWGDKIFSDGYRGEQVTIYVKKGALAEAKKIPA